MFCVMRYEPSPVLGPLSSLVDLPCRIDGQDSRGRLSLKELLLPSNNLGDIHSGEVGKSAAFGVAV